MASVPGALVGTRARRLWRWATLAYAIGALSAAATVGVFVLQLVELGRTAGTSAIDPTGLVMWVTFAVTGTLVAPAASPPDQSSVDRSFFRRKYDAARTLDGFAARLREEIDLDALQEELIGAVTETLRPVHASLWLR